MHGQTQICVNKPGSYECLCINGYHLESVVYVSDQSSIAIHLAVGIGKYLYYLDSSILMPKIPSS